MASEKPMSHSREERKSLIEQGDILLEEIKGLMMLGHDPTDEIVELGVVSLLLGKDPAKIYECAIALIMAEIRKELEDAIGQRRGMATD